MGSGTCSNALLEKAELRQLRFHDWTIDVRGDY